MTYDWAAVFEKHERPCREAMNTVDMVVEVAIKQSKVDEHFAVLAELVEKEGLRIQEMACFVLWRMFSVSAAERLEKLRTGWTDAFGRRVKCFLFRRMLNSNECVRGYIGLVFASVLQIEASRWGTEAKEMKKLAVAIERGDKEGVVSAIVECDVVTNFGMLEDLINEREESDVRVLAALVMKKMLTFGDVRRLEVLRGVWTLGFGRRVKELLMKYMFDRDIDVGMHIGQTFACVFGIETRKGWREAVVSIGELFTAANNQNESDRVVSVMKVFIEIIELPNLVDDQLLELIEVGIIVKQAVDILCSGDKSERVTSTALQCIAVLLECMAKMEGKDVVRSRDEPFMEWFIRETSKKADESGSSARDIIVKRLTDDLLILLDVNDIEELLRRVEKAAGYQELWPDLATLLTSSEERTSSKFRIVRVCLAIVFIFLERKMDDRVVERAFLRLSSLARFVEVTDDSIRKFVDEAKSLTHPNDDSGCDDLDARLFKFYTSHVQQCLCHDSDKTGIELAFEHACRVVERKTGTRDKGFMLCVGSFITSCCNIDYSVACAVDVRKSVANAPTSYYVSDSRPKEDEWLRLDFKQAKVSVTRYKIRSGMKSHMKSWVVEVSDDCFFKQMNVIEIDRREDNDDLNDSFVTRKFDVANKAEGRYVRIRQIGKNHMGTHHLECSMFDVFGSIQSALVTPKKGRKPGWIVKDLTQRNGGNVHKKGIVEVTASSQIGAKNREFVRILTCATERCPVMHFLHTIEVLDPKNMDEKALCCESGSILRVERCRFVGLWNPDDQQRQQSIDLVGQFLNEILGEVVRLDLSFVYLIVRTIARISWYEANMNGNGEMLFVVAEKMGCVRFSATRDAPNSPGWSACLVILTQWMELGRDFDRRGDWYDGMAIRLCDLLRDWRMCRGELGANNRMGLMVARMALECLAIMVKKFDSKRIAEKIGREILAVTVLVNRNIEAPDESTVLLCYKCICRLCKYQYNIIDPAMNDLFRITVRDLSGSGYCFTNAARFWNVVAKKERMHDDGCRNFTLGVIPAVEKLLFGALSRYEDEDAAIDCLFAFVQTEPDGMLPYLLKYWGAYDKASKPRITIARLMMYVWNEDIVCEFLKVNEKDFYTWMANPETAEYACEALDTGIDRWCLLFSYDRLVEAICSIIQNGFDYALIGTKIVLIIKKMIEKTRRYANDAFPRFVELAMRITLDRVEMCLKPDCDELKESFAAMCAVLCVVMEQIGEEGYDDYKERATNVCNTYIQLTQSDPDVCVFGLMKSIVGSDCTSLWVELACKYHRNGDPNALTETTSFIIALFNRASRSCTERYSEKILLVLQSDLTADHVLVDSWPVVFNGLISVLQAISRHDISLSHPIDDQLRAFLAHKKGQLVPLCVRDLLLQATSAAYEFFLRQAQPDFTLHRIWVVQQLRSVCRPDREYDSSTLSAIISLIEWEISAPLICDGFLSDLCHSHVATALTSALDHGIMTASVRRILAVVQFNVKC